MAEDWSKYKISDKSEHSGTDWSKYSISSDKTNNSASDLTNGDKPVVDTSLKASGAGLESNMSASDSKVDSEADSGAKVVSQGNLEASGAPDQNNIITPQEHESLLSKGWKLLDNPTARMLLTGSNDELEALKKSSGIVGTQGPELMKIPGLESLASSIKNKGINYGNYWIGFGSSILSDLISGASSGFDPRVSGIKELPNESSIKPDFISHAEIPNSDVLKQELLKDRPDLAAVGEESLVNKDRPQQGIPSINPEDKLLNLAKERQQMGLPVPRGEATDLTAPSNDIHNANLPRDLKNAKPRFNMGQNSYDPQFESDLDKSLFIIAQKTPSKRDADYLKFVMDTTGLNEQDARNAGIKIKSQVKDILKGEDPGSVKIPKLYQPIDNKLNQTPEQQLVNLNQNEDKLPAPSNSRNPIFNRKGQSGEAGYQQLKPKLLLNGDGTFTNKDTGEIFDMRGHIVNPEDHKPASLIDTTDNMNNAELRHEGGGNEPPDNYQSPEKPEDNKITLSDVINFPKSMKTLWHVGAAPFRQGAGLITTKPWWTAWNDLFEGMKGKESFDATQTAINNRPLFKSYNGQDSFAQKVGLKLTNLGNLSTREEDQMSRIADMIPGVKTTQRGYVAYLNKLRADTFENLMSKYKVIGENGEYNIPLAKQLAEYVNDVTGRSTLPNNKILGNLEKNAVLLNNGFFSPRFFQSRLNILGQSARGAFTPSTYIFSEPNIRREYLRSLLSIAGIGATLAELPKAFNVGTVEHDPTSSDFEKVKIGNTRIDPYAGLQQDVVLASRLITGKETSSKSGKTTDLNNPKFGQDSRMDVLGKFARSKESPVLSFVHSMAVGRRPDGTKFDLPEDVVNMFVPMILQDLKQVVTENPNLIPNYHNLGFDDANYNRIPLAIPGMMGMGEQNYPSRNP